jgi:hypothetical protein
VESKLDIKVDFHTDGRSEEMIPDLMSIGVTAINPVHPECDDPEHLKQKFGHKLVLKGTLYCHKAKINGLCLFLALIFYSAGC